MSYLGRGLDNVSNVEKLDNITFNGGTTYALTKSGAAFTPAGSNNILISIDGVVQQGNFSVSGSNIVFTFSPTSSNTCDFIMHYGTGLISTPADSTVTDAKIVDMATSKLTGTVSQSQIADQAINESKLQISNAPQNGYFLSAQSGNTGGLTWAEAGGGELEFIAKNISTSGGTYATMDNVFSSTYQNYVAHIGLSTSVENDVFFNYRVGASGSTSLSEDASYKYAGITARSNEATSTSNYGNNGDKVQITHGSNANDNRLSAFTGTMYFYTPHSTSFFARSTYTYFYQNSSAVVSGGAGGILYGYTTAAKTGFSFYTSGGTIDEINIRVYGIKDN